MFGEALSIAAAIATIKKLDKENAIQRIFERGGSLYHKVNEIKDHLKLSDAIKISGYAPRMMLTFYDYGGATKDQIRTFFMIEMAQQGVLIINSHNIMLAHDDAAAKRINIAYHKTMLKLRETIDRGDMEKVVGNYIVAEAPLRAAS
jgi:glutamate-1-semialdehyde aminotransferase